MNDTIGMKLQEWIQGKSGKEARIALFYQVRDIPYATIPELRDPRRYADIFKIQAGSCTPKHVLLAEMYNRIGLEVLYAVYPFRWDEFALLYPPDLKKLARDMPIGSHLACKVNIDSKLTLVDATIDPALEKAGFPVNKEWDGLTDTKLAVTPCGDEQLYHPSEAFIAQPRTIDDSSLVFYKAINSWLEKLRKEKNSTSYVIASSTSKIKCSTGNEQASSYPTSRAKG